MAMVEFAMVAALEELEDSSLKHRFVTQNYRRIGLPRFRLGFFFEVDDVARRVDVIALLHYRQNVDRILADRLIN